jgi:hypothetical protein
MEEYIEIQIPRAKLERTVEQIRSELPVYDYFDFVRGVGEGHGLPKHYHIYNEAAKKADKHDPEEGLQWVAYFAARATAFHMMHALGEVAPSDELFEYVLDIVRHVATD